MPTAANVSTGKPKVSGSIYNAPIGTAIPTSATEALNEAFVCVGHITEDGVENTQDMETSDIKAWGGAVVYRPLTEFKDSFKFAMLETKNADALKAYYGDSNVSVDGSGNIAVNVGAHEMPERIWVIDTVLRGGKARRLVIPDGQVSKREAITYKDEDPIAYGITVAAMPDASGETHYEYTEGGTGTNCSVTFNSNGGSAVASQTVVSGSTATQPSNPTKAGFTFAGWYTDTGLTNAFAFTTAITANTVLYAKWTS